jgi:hypothetical protein
MRIQNKPPSVSANIQTEIPFSPSYYADPAGPDKSLNTTKQKDALWYKAL